MDVLTFRRMLTPILLQIVFWIGTIGCVYLGGARVVSVVQNSMERDKEREREKAEAKARGDDPDRVPALRREAAFRERFESNSTAQELGFALGLMVGGPLVLRIWCEMTIVLFSIHRELVVANDRNYGRR